MTDSFDPYESSDGALRGSANWRKAKRREPVAPRAADDDAEERLQASRRALDARPHAGTLEITPERIVSGDRSADVEHFDGRLAIGPGPDDDLWLAFAEPERRPRPSAQLTERAARVEPNGLVRVLDRRASSRALRRLAQELGHALRPGFDDAVRIPTGRYGEVLVRDEGGGYTVRTRRAGRDAIEAVAVEVLDAVTFRVPDTETGALRRVLVDQLMPPSTRLLVRLTLNGRLGLAKPLRRRIRACIDRTYAGRVSARR